jgi:hypothetical protein
MANDGRNERRGRGLGHPGAWTGITHVRPFMTEIWSIPGLVSMRGEPREAERHMLFCYSAQTVQMVDAQ